MHLEVVRGPARAAVHLVAAGVQRDRQPGLGGRAQDRPVARVAEPLLGGPGQQHLDEARVAGQPLDLAHGEVGVLVRRADRAEQPRLLGEPLVADPVVERAAQLGRELGRLAAEALGLHRREDRVVDVVLVEVLAPHEPEVAAGAALLRPRVDAEAAVAHAREHRVRAGDARAERGVVPARAGAQPLHQRRGHHRRVDVDVDQRHGPLLSGARCGSARRRRRRSPPRRRPRRSRPRRARARARLPRPRRDSEPRSTATS